MSTLPRCIFSVRYPAGDGRWWYQRMMIANPGGGSIPMEPPLIGDLISLWGDMRTQPEGGPVFRVIDRCWMHASWGSGTWPYGAAEPSEGPLMDIILEPAGGRPYVDETDICAESTCEAVWMNGAWWFPPGSSEEPGPHEHAPWAADTGATQERKAGQ